MNNEQFGQLKTKIDAIFATLISILIILTCIMVMVGDI